MSRQLRREEYTVGWVCALPVELAAAQEMLDEEHSDLKRKHDDNDENLYTLGSIAGHSVVIVCLPAGRIGNNPAASIATQMRATFKGIRFGLMVGIGGGVPNVEDIRLGDVVVSQPHQTFAGVVQYDTGKSTPSGFERTGSLNSPPQILLAAVARVQADELRGRSKLSTYASKLECIPKFQRSKTGGRDILFEAGYDHEGGPTCEYCSADRQQLREQRDSEEDVVVHYGTVASGNQVMKNAAERDRVSAELGGVLCFEMEAAGLMNTFPCLVIRGICDYADSHKNKRWQAYAAGTAAAYAKELLSVIPAAEVVKTHPAEEAMYSTSEHDSELCSSPSAKRRKIDPSNGLHDGIVRFKPADIHVDYESTDQAYDKFISTDFISGARSLSFPEQEHRYDDIHTAKDTCGWILQHPQFCAWMESPQGLFWVKGNPGSGKSVLMKYAVQKLRETQPDKLVSSFFAHGQGKELQKTPLGIFRALLNSMLQNFPAHLAQLTAIFEEREKRFGGYMADRWKWTDKELQDFLTTVLTKGTKSQPAIIFVDALDECGEGPAKSLLAYFKDLAKQAEREGAQVKICFSSRHYPILGLETVPAMSVEEQNGEDILWYTRDRLKDIQPEFKRQQIEDEILLKARGGFQWVFLVTETIIGRNLAGIRAEKLLEELTSCPETLSELYAALLSGITEAEKHQVVKLFRWVLYAERPLSAQELREALATDADMSYSSVSRLRTHEGWSNTLADFERHVKHISRGLVQFQTREIWEQYDPDGEDSDREAQLIHQSVADYLSDRFLLDIAQSQHVLESQAGAGHFQISRSCLKYLTLREVLEATELPRGILSSRFPLAPYATRYLFEHIHKVELEGVPQHDLLSVIQWAPQSNSMKQLADLLRVLDPNSAHTPLGWPFAGATAFHVLAAFGSKSALDVALNESEGTIDGRDSHMNTPLLLAIREGHQDIAMTLLNRFIEWQSQHRDTPEEKIGDDNHTGQDESRFLDVNAENNDGDTALTIALGEKAEEVIFKLIEAGADLKYMGRETALVAYAISSKNTRLLVKLIEKGVCLDGAVFFILKDSALDQDDVLKDMVSELLKAGANVSQSEEFERACEPEYHPEDYPEDYDEDYPEDYPEDYDENHDEDHSEDHDEDHDENHDGDHDGDYSEDQEEDHDKFQKEHVSSFDDDAVIVACRRGMTDLVNLLLSHGASATCQNRIGEWPLLAATYQGNEKMMQVLLHHAPSAVEMQDHYGQTVLDVAVKYKDLCLLTLLVRQGNYSTSTSALEKCFTTITRYGANRGGVSDLIETFSQKDGINLDVRGEDGHTALSWAADCGDHLIVKWLLDSGKVDVDLKDENGQPPLFWAAANGHEAVVKLLLDTSTVDVNAQDNAGHSPLWVAACNGHEAVVMLLLDTKTVDVNAQDNAGRSPLWAAASNGCETIIKLLLETSNVDVNTKDQNGCSPLALAVATGYEAIVKLLLQTSKVDVNGRDRDGQPPLWWAAANGHQEIVKLLLETGNIDIDTEHNIEWALLSWATAKQLKDVVELLPNIEKMDEDAEEEVGQSLLWWAAQTGREAIVKLLFETGKVDMNAKDNHCRTSLSWAAQNGHDGVVNLLVLKGDVDINAKDNHGRTPLSLAAQNGHEAVVKLLLSKKRDVDINTRDIYERTPLLWAAAHGQEAVAKLLCEMDEVKIDVRDNYGRTPLSWAAQNGQETVVKLLLKTRNANVHISDNVGQSPLWWARLHGHEKVVELLKKALQRY